MFLSYKDVLKSIEDNKKLNEFDLEKIFKNPDDILSFLEELLSKELDFRAIFKENWELFSQIISPLKYLENVPQNNPYHYADVLNHTIDALCKYDGNNWMVRLALLLHDTGKKSTRTTEDGIDHFYGHPEVSKNLVVDWGTQFSKTRIISNIVFLVGIHDANIPISRSSVNRFMLQFKGLDISIYDWVDMKRADILAHKVTSSLLEKLEIMENLVEDVNRHNILEEVKRSLPINGLDIKSLGFSGKDIGLIKEDCLDFYIKVGFSATHKDLMNYIKSKYM